MSNMIKIMLRDLKSISTNVVAMVIIMGLCVIPSLYAWFNINSNWDPYREDATSNLKIAVFSKDQGIKLQDILLTDGDSVVDALHDNTAIGWIFTEDERTAINGVYSGEYYAALVIPEDFTKNIAGVLDGELDGGKMLYYENDKKNAIASKITGKARTAVQTQVNNTVFRNDLDLISTVSTAIGISEIQTANVRLQDYLLILEDGQADLKQMKKLLKKIYKQVDQIEVAVSGIGDNESLQQAAEILQNEPEKIGTFFSTPVDVQTEPVYPIKNYGSQMAPFYTILSIWVGALILVAIIHTKVKPMQNITDVKHYQEYFGRYAIFFLVGQVQTLICVLGDLFFMEIQCKHIFLFWCAAALASFVFTLFIYSLTYAFGNVGEALAIIVMVVQVAGAGGTFPKEVLPEVYQRIYSFLPFPYAMDALKEAVGGQYQNAYLVSLGKLAAFAALSFLIGLVLSIPFRRLNEMIAESKEQTDFMI